MNAIRALLSVSAAAVTLAFTADATLAVTYARAVASSALAPTDTQQTNGNIGQILDASAASAGPLGASVSSSQVSAGIMRGSATFGQTAPHNDFSKSAFAEGKWDDVITFTSPGDVAVDVQWSITVHGAAEASGTGVFAGANFSFMGGVLSYAVNHAGSITGTFNAVATYPANVPKAIFGEFQVSAGGSPSAIGSANAAFHNTALIGLTILTPGATFTASSGHHYVIPEPTTAATAAIAALATTMTRRRTGVPRCR